MISNINEVYNYFEDQKSKDIFLNKVLFEITDDFNYINNIVKVQGKCEQLLFSEKEKAMLTNKMFDDTKKIVIYGAGIVGKIMKSMIPKERIFSFCDINRDLQKEKMDRIPIYSPEKIIEDKPDVYIVLAIWKNYQKEVIDRFMLAGFEKERIIDGTEYFNIAMIDSDMYFDEEIILFSKDEVFLDCGCYDFSTSNELLERNKSVKKIFAFEPDRENYKKCEKAIKNKSCQVELFCAGLWDKKTQLYFNAFGGMGSKIVEEGSSKIDVLTIDEVVKEEKVTFIKMDIEGAELEALIGGQRVIKEYRPTLAISVYHKMNDMITIPRYIKSIVPEYKFYLRHYTNAEVDTVLYAII